MIQAASLALKALTSCSTSSSTFKFWTVICPVIDTIETNCYIYLIKGTQPVNHYRTIFKVVFFCLDFSVFSVLCVYYIGTRDLLDSAPFVSIIISENSNLIDI